MLVAFHPLHDMGMMSVDDQRSEIDDPSRHGDLLRIGVTIKLIAPVQGNHDVGSLPASRGDVLLDAFQRQRHATLARIRRRLCPDVLACSAYPRNANDRSLPGQGGLARFFEILTGPKGRDPFDSRVARVFCDALGALIGDVVVAQIQDREAESAQRGNGVGCRPEEVPLRREARYSGTEDPRDCRFSGPRIERWE